MTIETKAKPQVATMNAVHDLPVLVARDEGFFKDEGLDIEFVTTPGMAQGPFALQFGNGPKDAPGGAIKWRKVQIKSL